MIFQTHALAEIPNIVAVRGIARQVGTTSLAVNLGLALAQRDEKTLLLDLSLWNCDLTQLFGYEPTPIFIALAQEFDDHNELRIDSIRESAKSCRQNLDLLPGTPRWIEAPELQSENGWNFIHALFVHAKELWQHIIVDLGSHLPHNAQRDNTFLPACAVHASILQASSVIVNVFDSIESLRIWQTLPNHESSVQAQALSVVNQHHGVLPFGLDRLKLESNLRISSYLIPFLKDGLVPQQGELFFVERAAELAKPSRDTKVAARTIQEIAACVSRVRA